MVSMSVPDEDIVENVHDLEDSGEDTDDEEMEDSDAEVPGLFDHLPHDGIPLEGSAPCPPANITTLEIVIIMLDWICTHKITDTASGDLWNRLRLIVPEGVDTSTFDHAKGIVTKYKDLNVQRIDLCVNDCIAFWDCKNIPEKKSYKHSHRTVCPECNEPRYITKDGRTLPRKVVYHTPVASFVHNLYKRADMVPFLYSDADGHQAGHVTRSRGWKKKMLDDDKMGEDHRNIALIGTTDGVPFFEDQIRGAWPFVYRVGNLPDGLAKLSINTHIAMITANEHLRLDPVTNTVGRVIKGPKSLHPHLMILGDDLYAGYHKGILVTDYTCLRGSPERTFWCRTMLLFWCGDYPAQGKVSEIKASGKRHCHWCNIWTPHSKVMKKHVVGGYRRYLPPTHSRRYEKWGRSTELRQAPENRTHAGVVTDAEANENHTGYEIYAPHHTTGVKRVSPLCYLPYFDIVWDIAPDVMHIIEGILKNHILPLMKGNKLPTMPVKRKKDSQEVYNKTVAQWKRECQNATKWVCTPKQQKMLDQRSRNLGGERGWIRSNRPVCKRTGSLKAHDWLKIAESAGQYIFHNLYEDTNQNETLMALMQCFSDLVQAHSHAEHPDYVPDMAATRSNMLALKEKIAMAMTLFDEHFPASEKTIVFHIILHVPDWIHRWGSVRNGWCFYGER
jgi:hypothetical protein